MGLRAENLPITAVQAATLDALIAFINEAGYPPSLRELGARLDLPNHNALRDRLIALERKGFLACDAYGNRAIRVLRFPDGAPARVVVTRDMGLALMPAGKEGA